MSVNVSRRLAVMIDLRLQLIAAQGGAAQVSIIHVGSGNSSIFISRQAVDTINSFMGSQVL